MLFPFTKNSGHKVAIDLTRIVGVDDLRDHRVIETLDGDYEVMETLSDIVEITNKYKIQHIFKYYN